MNLRRSSITRLLALDPGSQRLHGTTWVLLLLCLLSSMFSIALAQAAFVAGVVTWVATLRFTSHIGWRSVLIHTPWLVFTLSRILAILVSTRPDLSMASFHREIAFLAMYPLAVDLLGRSVGQRLTIVFRVLFLASVVAAGIGAVRFGLGLVPRAESTTAGYYTLGAFLAMGIVATAALWRDRTVFPTRWIPAVGMLVMLIGLLLTFNRMHWISTAVALLVIGIRRERRLLLGAAVAAALVVALVPQVRDRLLTLGDIRSNASGRDVIFRGAWMLAGEHPWTGFGTRTFREIFPLWDDMPDKGVGSWHNDYVQSYMEGGTVGLLAYAALFVQAFVLTVRRMRRSKGDGPPHADALFAVLLVFAISGCTYDSLPALWFRLTLAAVVVLACGEGAPHTAER